MLHCYMFDSNLQKGVRNFQTFDLHPDCLEGQEILILNIREAVKVGKKGVENFTQVGERIISWGKNNLKRNAYFIQKWREFFYSSSKYQTGEYSTVQYQYSCSKYQTGESDINITQPNGQSSKANKFKFFEIFDSKIKIYCFDQYIETRFVC